MQVAETELAAHRADSALPAIAVDGVTRRFGTVEALRGITFQVQQREIFGLLGPNGAGKTTLIRTLLSLIPPSSGSVHILGLDVTRESERARGLIGWVPQRSANDPMLTARENLTLMAGMYHLRRAAATKRVAALLELVDLVDAADRVVQTYSGGMRKRLDLAMGLIQQPRVLLLDEPTLGLDIQTRQRLWTYIESFRAMGTTILLTTHYLEEADALCDRIAIIDGGLIRALDTPDQLKKGFGGDSIQLEVAAQTPAALVDQFILTAAAMAGVTKVRQREPGGLLLDVDDHVRVLHPLLDAAERLGINLVSVMPSRPSLDTVFLGLTGYSLREETETN